LEKTIIAILDFFKNIVEKYLIPMVLAFVLAAVTYFKTRENNAFLDALGKEMCFMVYACVYFLLIELIVTIVKGIRKFIKTKENKISIKKANEKRQKDNLESLWKLIDNLEATEYGYVEKLINNSNTPLQIRMSSYPSAYFENIIHTTRSRTKQGYDLIRLKDDIFNLLVYSKELCGKISHFER
jgi:predicted PurR-regulated permease PerM